VKEFLVIIILTSYLLCSLCGLQCLSPYLGDVLDAVWGGEGRFAGVSYWQHIADFSFMY